MDLKGNRLEGPDSYGFTVAFAWLETPTPDRVLGGSSESGMGCGNNLDASDGTVSTDDELEAHFAFNLGPPKLTGIARLALHEGSRPNREIRPFDHFSLKFFAIEAPESGADGESIHVDSGFHDKGEGIREDGRFVGHIDFGFGIRVFRGWLRDILQDGRHEGRWLDDGTARERIGIDDLGQRENEKEGTTGEESGAESPQGTSAKARGKKGTGHDTGEFVRGRSTAAGESRSVPVC